MGLNQVGCIERNPVRQPIRCYAGGLVLTTMVGCACWAAEPHGRMRGGAGWAGFEGEAVFWPIAGLGIWKLF
jgi:hypothetical protein